MKLDLRGPVTAYVVLSLALLVPLARFYWPAANGLDVTGHPIGRDFINVWVGPQLAFGDSLSTLFDLKAYHDAIGALFGQKLPFHNWGYPAFTLAAFWPLAQLPYFWALAVWTFGLFAAFAAVVLSQVPADKRRIALLLLALAPACLINAVGGQNGFATAALLVGGILSIDRRPVLAGVLFGLLTFKPHLGLILPLALVALGAWRVIAVAALTTVLLIVGSIALLGVEPWRHYLGETSAYQMQLIRVFEGFYTIMMASVLAGARTFGVSFGVAMALQVVVAIPVLVTALWAVRRARDPMTRVAVLVGAVPLLTPYAFNYDLTAIAAVLVWRLVGAWPSEPRWDRICLLTWLAPTAMMPLNMIGLGIAPLANIAFYVAVLATVWREVSLGRQPAPVAST
ncbi:MAG TPA: glycosyltransferase family 87 protein [Vineibacter sp.]|nr:glycosyltransferase family 87 protein [Vineibacter sp.]